MPITPKTLPQEAAPMIKPATQGKKKALGLQRNVNQIAKARYDALRRHARTR